MGITGLARWINAPMSGLDLIHENIMRNHNGQYRNQWKLQIRSYRSMPSAPSGQQPHVERTMCALTMDNNVFVLLDDPYAPTRADIQLPLNPSIKPYEPPHYRNTFLTLSPPGALEHLLALLRAKWISARQTAPGQPQSRQASGHQLTIEGGIFAIGNDWIVRAGNVILSGGAVKGMLLEAEYLPVPTMSSQPADKTSELLSNLLLSVLPNVRDAKTVAVTISDAQWEDVLWDREEEQNEQLQAEANKDRHGVVDDLYIVDDEDVPVQKKGDWTGVDRDRRSAYLIIGALKSEGLV